MLLFFLLLLSLPSWSQVTQFNALVQVRPGTLSITSDGEWLQFRETRTDLRVRQRVEAVRAPGFTIVDATGSGRGWQVVVSAQDLKSPAGDVIPSRNLFFEGSGAQGRVWRVTGRPEGLGAAEVDGRVGLHNAEVLHAGPGRGAGQFRWQPRPQQFILEIGPDVPAGTYQGQVTFTVLSRP